MLKVLIIGHGAVGLTLGELLLNKSNGSIFVGYYSSKSPINQGDNYIIHRSNVNVNFCPFFINDKDIAEFNILIFCLKSYHFKYLTNKKLSIKPDAICIILSNGYGLDAALHSILHHPNVINGIIYVSAEKEKKSVINHSKKITLLLNRDDINNSASYNLIRKFKRCLPIDMFPIKLTITKKFFLEQWRKVSITNSINGVCIYFDNSPNQVFKDKEKLNFLYSLLEESFIVGRSLGLQFSKKYILRAFYDICSMPGECKPSMYRDYKKGNDLEIDFLNKKIISIARLHDIKTPCNDKIIEKINLHTHAF